MVHAVNVQRGKQASVICSFSLCQLCLFGTTDSNCCEAAFFALLMHRISCLPSLCKLHKLARGIVACKVLK